MAGHLNAEVAHKYKLAALLKLLQFGLLSIIISVKIVVLLIMNKLTTTTTEDGIDCICARTFFCVDK